MFLLVTPTLATSVTEGLNTAADKGGISKSTGIPGMVGRVINALFGVLGVVFLAVILIGGYTWMTAGGNEESVGKAKKFILNGTFGIMVILLSYVLVFTIATSLNQAIG